MVEAYGIPRNWYELTTEKSPLLDACSRFCYGWWHTLSNKCDLRYVDVPGGKKSFYKILDVWNNMGDGVWVYYSIED